MVKFILIAVGITAIWWFMRRSQVEQLDAEVIDAAHILGVPRRASIEEINAAHRKRIAESHPDRGGSEELSRRLNAARDTMIKARRS